MRIWPNSNPVSQRIHQSGHTASAGLITGLGLAVLVSLMWAIEVAAQVSGLLVNIPHIDSQAFPQVTAYVTVVDENGLPVAGLTAADFVVYENGVQVPAEDITVENATISGLTLVLAIDLSTPNPNLPQVKNAVKAFIDTLQPPDKLALLAFYDDVTLLADFTNNTQTLKAAVEPLAYKGNYTALYETMFESAAMLERFPTGRRAIILLPDIKNNIDTLPFDQAINKVQEARVPLYLVSFQEKAKPGDFDNISASLVGASAVVFPTAQPVQGRLLEIGDQLRQGYKISYRSNLPADNASHTLLLNVTGQGRAGQATAQFVAVSNEVIITLPGLTDGQTVSGIVNLTAQVTAPAPVVAVDYLVDGQPLQTLTTPPYSFEWDTTGLTTGLHSLSARATDDAGRQGQISVNLKVTPPLVVTVSTAQEEVNIGDVVAVQARVVAMAEVTRIDLLLDGQLLSSNNVMPAELTLDSSRQLAGAHVVTVWVQDSQGHTAQDSVTLQFVPPPPAPPSPLWWWLRAALAIIVAALVLALLLLLLLLLLRARPRPQRFILEFQNQGNTPNRYKVRAEEASGALTFEFALNGMPLPLEQALLPAGGGAMATMAASPPAPASYGSSRQPAQTGPRFARPANPLKQTGHTLGCLSTALTPFLTLFSVVASFLPQSIGGPIQRWVDGVRGVESGVSGRISMAQTNVEMTERAFKGAGDQLSAVSPTQPANGPEAIAAPISVPVGGAAAGVATAPAPTGSARPTTHPLYQAAPASHTWALTPILEPGGTLTVELILKPVNPNRTQEYTFRVVSKLVGRDDLPPLVESGTVHIKGPGWFSRLVKLLLFLLVAIVVSGSTALIVLWLLQIDIRSLPILRDWLG